VYESRKTVAVASRIAIGAKPRSTKEKRHLPVMLNTTTCLEMKFDILPTES